MSLPVRPFHFAVRVTTPAAGLAVTGRSGAALIAVAILVATAATVSEPWTPTETSWPAM